MKQFFRSEKDDNENLAFFLWCFYSLICWIRECQAPEYNYSLFSWHNFIRGWMSLVLVSYRTDGLFYPSKLTEVIWSHQSIFFFCVEISEKF